MPAKSVLLPLVTVSLLLISPAAWANSFSITGHSDVSSIEFGNFVNGGLLSIATTTESGPETVGFATPGSIVHFRLIDPFFSLLQGVSGNNVTFGTQSTDMMTGSLIFSGTFTAPSAGNNTEVTITFPTSMTGNLTAFKDLGGGGIQGPAMFAFNFKGSGTMTLTVDELNGVDILSNAQMTYRGTATTVPEPSSLLLLGSGLAGLAKMRRKSIHLG